MKHFIKYGCKKLKYSFISIFFITAATFIGFLFNFFKFPETNIVVVYILSILLVALFTEGYYYGIMSTFIETALYNYFFTKPYFTLSVDDPTYIITFIIMALTSIITSTLTSKVIKNTSLAQESEMRANILYEIANRLNSAEDLDEIVRVTVSTISSFMDCKAALLIIDDDGKARRNFVQKKDGGYQLRKNTEDENLIDNMRNNDTLYGGNEFVEIPIKGSDSILGIVRIPKDSPALKIQSKMKLLKTMIESTALAMDRIKSINEKIKSEEERNRERYRANLLRAISHDLRTPLAGIMGTAEMLMSMNDKNDERYFLTNSIYKDADWLHSLVENILNLTRLQDGKLRLDKEYQAVEEVVGAAVVSILKRAPEYDISVNIPHQMLLVPMDARLINQVLINLLDNAVKHSLESKHICVSVDVDRDNKYAVFKVKDEGSGIIEGDLEHLFKMFYTTRGKATDSQRGIGLGLAICESIIKAHGGTITARNRDDIRGAEIIFTLPLEEDKYE